MVRKLLLAVSALLVVLAPNASAQVFVDPDSPAGKEYAIPVDRAKRDAGVPVAPDDGDAGEEDLFGAGITPQIGGGSTEAGETTPGGGQPSAGSGSESGSGSGSGGSSDGRQPEPLSSAQGSSSARAGVRADFASPAPSSDALPWLLGGGLLVLLAGAGGGALARRSAGRSSTA